MEKKGIRNWKGYESVFSVGGFGWMDSYLLEVTDDKFKEFSRGEEFTWTVDYWVFKGVYDINIRYIRIWRDIRFQEKVDEIPGNDCLRFTCETLNSGGPHIKK